MRVRRRYVRLRLFPMCRVLCVGECLRAVVRAHSIGISTGNPLSFEPSLNVFNGAALDAADYAISVAESLGIRLIVPLTDDYHYYLGGKHDFTDWLGLNESEFYTSSAAIGAFENVRWLTSMDWIGCAICEFVVWLSQYISHRVQHVNPYTNRTAANEPAILAWETGNELSPPSNWTQTIAEFIKSVDGNHLVLDGSFGVNVASLPIAAVDMYR